MKSDIEIARSIKLKNIRDINRKKALVLRQLLDRMLKNNHRLLGVLYNQNSGCF